VVRQPETPDEVARATLAMLVCPTTSIGVEGEGPRTQNVLPWELDRGVYLCGYNSTATFGASSYFVAPGPTRSGGLLIDSPRWVPALAKRFEELGGISDVLLTHCDDVAHADRYASHFGARVWIHEHDKFAAPFATSLLRGRDPVLIREDLRVIPVPGHTRGSVMFLLEDRYLFTGDSLYWSRELADLSAFKERTWHSWAEQTRSLEHLASFPFEWVLPGHGDRQNAPAAAMRASLMRLVGRMRANDPKLDDMIW
jgi:glyoxylase-like metal-dependent hydrolase (beta-lactamase superfamily II)